MIVIYHYGRIFGNIYDIVVYTKKKILFTIQDFMGPAAADVDMISQIESFMHSLQVEVDQSVEARHPAMFHNCKGPSHMQLIHNCNGPVSRHHIIHYPELYDLVGQLMSYLY